MHFTIDAARYAVAIAARPLIHHGQPCLAKLDRFHRRIWLSDQLPKSKRRLALFHEIRHCWIDARGKARDEEADADQAAEMMDAILEQYLQQGGDAVMEELAAAEDVSTAKEVNGVTIPTEVRCGFCDALTALGSVANSHPLWSAEFACNTIDRGILCGICGYVTCWREVATAEGMPTGKLAPYPPPRILVGPDAGEWIAAHQDVCRVLCV